MSDRISPVPFTVRAASRFVDLHHRHHEAPQGGLWSVGAEAGGEIVGVAIVGWPVSAAMQNGVTAEIRRLCTVAAAPKGTCSWLISRCWRIWQIMGGRRLITYTLQAESGDSLRGAGMRKVREIAARDWGACSRQRPRRKTPASDQPKWRWELEL